MTENGYTLSDIAAATGGRNDGMFGNGGDWGAWIILFLLFGLFGRGGWGGGFGGAGEGYGVPCATQADVRAAVDQQTLISKLDQQTYGLADSTYALNNAITGGFNGVQQTLCQGFNGVNTGMLTGFNGIQSQIADCCCTTQRAIEGVNYNLATTACDIKHAMSDNTRDLLENQNANTRAVLDFLVNDKISTLQAENQELRLQASQAYLVNELRPCPVPAYITCNPYAASYGYGQYGYNNGCGCGC